MAWRVWAVKVDSLDACRLCKAEPVADDEPLPVPCCFQHFFAWMHGMEQRGWNVRQVGGRRLYCDPLVAAVK